MPGWVLLRTSAAFWHTPCTELTTDHSYIKYTGWKDAVERQTGNTQCFTDLFLLHSYGSSETAHSNKLSFVDYGIICYCCLRKILPIWKRVEESRSWSLCWLPHFSSKWILREQFLNPANSSKIHQTAPFLRHLWCCTTCGENSHGY